MRVELGVKVQSSDGKDLGAIKNVIVDVESREVRSVVVEKGFLFKEDREVPLDRLAERSNGYIRLSMTADEADNLPFYDEGRYMEMPVDLATTLGYPPGGTIWAAPMPTSGGFGAYPTGVAPADAAIWGTTNRVDEAPPDDEARRIEQQNAVIGEGSEVFSSDGHKVGEVASVAFESLTGRPITLRIRRGFLFAHEIEIPAGAIASVDDLRVELKVDKARMETYAADNTVPLL